MQVFFEEDLSRKLIKTHQILLWIFIGYLEAHEKGLFETSKMWSNVKNIIKYLHRSYLVFIQFINGNLSEDQYTTAMDWASKLNNILNTRPVMKNFYDIHNSELLKNNNEISIILIKDLLRSKTANHKFKIEIINILSWWDTVELMDVRIIMNGKL